MTDASILLATIERGGVALEERIRAAHALAERGDPRVRARELVEIPGGAFVMGEEQRRLALPTFRIDKYPVTVGAYREFVEGGGYRERAFWSSAGWAFLREGSIEAPRFWGEPEWSAYLVENHPVVGVSAFEAEAYARYRGMRLPTEAEWEKAARGTSGRRFPWGDEFQEDACGMRGVGPRSTVPIGVFPRGASLYGVFDLVGSVWQWCSDPFLGWGGDPADRPAAPDAADARRTTAGGAWNTLQWSVSCLGRNGYPCSARFSNLGFRCVADGPEPAARDR
jgi:gamma-glutamyl hercynylcysteine S-oxide synthase